MPFNRYRDFLSPFQTLLFPLHFCLRLKCLDFSFRKHYLLHAGTASLTVTKRLEIADILGVDKELSVQALSQQLKVRQNELYRVLRYLRVLSFFIVSNVSRKVFLKKP